MKKSRLLWPIVIILIIALVAPAPAAAKSAEDFERIASGGFDSAMNNYAWSMAEFEGDLYVGTGRNIPYQGEAGVRLQLGLPDNIGLAALARPREPIGSYEWALDMCAEIWRYDGTDWERVYQSVPVDISDQFGLPEGNVWTAREMGFRKMITYTDNEGTALYATNGSQVPGYSDTGSLILRSTDGINWEQIGIGDTAEAWDSRTMVVHDGKLYIGLSTIIGLDDKAEIWFTDDPADPHSWEMAADLTPLGNQAVATLTNFNGLLYAGTVNERGYQIWRTLGLCEPDPSPDVPGWKMIVKDGAGDMTNLFAGTTKVFNGQLYVGSMSVPLPTGDIIRLPKGFELIRINPDDSWELLIGDRIAQNRPPGAPLIRTRTSDWPGGFANPLNFYCWSLEIVDGELYLGTFDASILLIELLRQGISLENPSLFQRMEIARGLRQVIGSLGSLGMSEGVGPMTRLLQSYTGWSFCWLTTIKANLNWSAGGDIWKSPDGVNWTPVTLDGLGNPHNYGIREMLNTGTSLYAGTANPFDGCEVFEVVLEPKEPEKPSFGLRLLALLRAFISRLF